MIFSFPKSVRLRTRSQYQRLNHHSHRYTGRCVVIEFKKTPPQEESPRLGITVTKRYGKSHDRNRFKRLVREAFRLCRDKMTLKVDMVVKPKTSKDSLHFNDVMQDFLDWASS